MTLNYSVVDVLSAPDKFAVYPANQGDWRVSSFTTLVTFLSTAFNSLRAVSYIATNATTVANLPTAATAGAGARAFVTDANSTSFNASLVGGGSNAVPVFSDGSAWRIG